MKTYDILPEPVPFLDGPFQSGISDPKYPLLPPDNLKEPELYERYKGIVDKQKCCKILRGNVLCTTRNELKTLLEVMTYYSYRAMERRPSLNNLLPLDKTKIPETYRVSVTIGMGYSLFVDKHENDRFGLRGQKPKYLKPMPSFPGDDAEFSPKERQTDIIVMIASDSQYVNVYIARYFCEKINKDCSKRLNLNETKEFFKVTSIEDGFGRPDEREFLRFNDGIDNLRSGIDLEELVYVDNRSNEPEWCINGSYMVYRKIREMMPIWEAFSDHKQSQMIGRDKDTSKPLSRSCTGIANLTPVYPDHTDDTDGKLDSHIRKVQPRRNEPDLFGILDLDRRFLRRPYPFFEGVDENGKGVNGLQFIAFMKSIQQQFEHVTNMWQMNEDFPVPGTGIDALYKAGVLNTVDGGYYFCPPAPQDENDFFGSGMFQEFGPESYDIPDYVYGYGITFVDIDETVFRTFALVKVIKDGKVIHLLNNQEYNRYELKDGETFDYAEFKDAETFNKTSEAINPMVARVKEIVHRITTKSKGSMLVFLTARSDFNDKDLFLNTFRMFGIDMDSDRVYVERSGNDTSNISVAQKKKKVVLKYLEKGTFRRVRLIDDNEDNLIEFLKIEDDIPDSIITDVINNHSLTPDMKPIEFSAFIVDHHGKMHPYEINEK